MAAVLIIDDRPVNRDLVRTVLGYQGHETIEASGGVEALRLLRERSPDLVVADVLMPGMADYQLARAVRVEAETRAIPVVFYAENYVESEIRPIANAVGVERIVDKSGDLTELIQAIDHTLGVSVPAAPQLVPAEDVGREQVRVLSARLHLAEDRGRIARELHDVVIQRLFGMGLRLERLRGQLPRDVADELSGVTDDLDRTIDDIRTTIFWPP